MDDLGDALRQAPPFDWAALQTALEEVAALVKPTAIDGRVLSFPSAVEVLRDRAHRGIDDGKRLCDLFKHMDALEAVMISYRAWKQGQTLLTKANG